MSTHCIHADTPLLAHASDGLSSANLIAATATNSGNAGSTRGGAAGKRGGRGGKRGAASGASRGKLQNTHLKDVDLTRDYVGE